MRRGENAGILRCGQNDKQGRNAEIPAAPE